MKTTRRTLLAGLMATPLVAKLFPTAPQQRGQSFCTNCGNPLTYTDQSSPKLNPANGTWVCGGCSPPVVLATGKDFAWLRAQLELLDDSPLEWNQERGVSLKIGKANSHRQEFLSAGGRLIPTLMWSGSFFVSVGEYAAMRNNHGTAGRFLLSRRREAIDKVWDRAVSHLISGATTGELEIPSLPRRAMTIPTVRNGGGYEVVYAGCIASSVTSI